MLSLFGRPIPFFLWPPCGETNRWHLRLHTCMPTERMRERSLNPSGLLVRGNQWLSGLLSGSSGSDLKDKTDRPHYYQCSASLTVVSARPSASVASPVRSPG